MTCEQLRDAVVAAALRWASVSDADRDLAEDALMVAVAAYQPHAHTEAREVVTLAVWQFPDGDIEFCKVGSATDGRSRKWTRLGTTQITITPEGGR